MRSCLGSLKEALLTEKFGSSMCVAPQETHLFFSYHVHHMMVSTKAPATLRSGLLNGQRDPLDFFQRDVISRALSQIFVCRRFEVS